MLLGTIGSFLQGLFPACAKSRVVVGRGLCARRSARLRLAAAPVSCQRLEERLLLTDTTPPVATLLSPNSGTFNVGQTITVTGTATDDSGVIQGTTYKLMQNGTLKEFLYITSSGGLKTSVDWRITPEKTGTYQFEIDVTDPSGNIGKDTSGDITIVADSTPPTATLTAPNSGTYSVGDVIHMTATGSDNDKIVGTTFELWQNNSRVSYLDSTATYTTSFDWQIPAKIGSTVIDGSYQLRVEYTDPSQNKTADFSDGNIVIGGGDTTPPAVTLTAPDTGSFTVGQTITLSGNATDANGIDHTRFDLWKGNVDLGSIFNGASGSGVTGSYSWTIPATFGGGPLATGSDYKIEMLAYDPSNNIGSDFSNNNLTITANADTTPPITTLTYADSGTFNVGQTIVLTSTASDANGIDHTYYELWQGNTFIGYIYTGSNGTGFKSSYSWVVPATLNGHTLSGTGYQFRVEVWDPSNNNANDFSNGNITFQAADTTRPITTLTSPNSGTLTVGQTVTLTGTASDANGINRTSYELWNGTTFLGYIYQGANGSGFKSSYSWLVPAVFNGHTLGGTGYRLRIEVWDPSNNNGNDYSDSTLTIVVPDTTRPTTTLTSPNSGTLTIGQTITLTSTASDANGINRTSYELWNGTTFLGYIYQGANGSGFKSSYSWLVPAVFNGHTLGGTGYRLRVEVWDPSNNNGNDYSDSTLTIQAAPVDTTPPTVNLISPNGGTFVVSNTITITSTASDAGGINRTSYELWQHGVYIGPIYQGAPGSGHKASFSWTITSTLGGVPLNGDGYSIKAIVWDTRGNFSADFSTSSITIIPANLPSIVSFVRTNPSTSVTNVTNITYTLTFNMTVTGVDAADFVINKSGSVVVSNTLVIQGSGSVYTITINGITGNGAVSLTLVNNSSIRNSSSLVLSTFNVTTTFTSVQNVVTGGAPRGVSVADFNRDGRADLAIVNSSSDSVSVLLGNGNGTFGAPRNYATGSSPYSLAVADLNGDGRADLVVANTGSNTLSVLLGNGNGTFGAARNYATGNYPFSVGVWDFNGDGRLDLAVTNDSSNTVTVLLGNGNGTFASPRNFATGSNPLGIASGDMNGDGRADLVISNYSSNSVSVLLGNGNGTFAAAKNFITGTHPRAVAVGDLNGDGRLDLIVDNFSSYSVSVLLGNGNGTFAAAKNFATGAKPVSVSVADINGDGRLDLAVANFGSNTVSVLLGNGNGTFASSHNFNTGNGPAFVLLQDINFDRRVDIIVANTGGNTLSVMTANGGFVTFVTTIDQTAPTAVWSQEVTPTTTAADAVIITFSEAMQNVSLANFSLNGTKLNTLSGIFLTAINGNVYVISGLHPYDATATTYTVAVVAGNTLKDKAGNALVGTPSMSWVMAAPPPPQTSVSSAALAMNTNALDNYWVEFPYGG